MVDLKKDEKKRLKDQELEEVVSILLLSPLGDPQQHPSDPLVRKGIPFIIEGLSGIGKTSRIKDSIVAAGLIPHIVFAGTKQPEDFAGAFVPTAKGLSIECVLPAARRCIENGGGAIFLDEVNGASPRTQYALLAFVDERQSGDHLLPPATRIALGMNPTEYATGGNVISGAFANRMAWLYADVPEPPKWGNWITGQREEYINIAEAEALVAQNWALEWATTVGLAVGFSQRIKKEVLHKQPLPDDPASSGPWPSPRTWYFAMRGITTARSLKNAFRVDVKPVMKDGQQDTTETTMRIAAALKAKCAQLQRHIVDSLVGPESALIWHTWVRDADLPSPVEMLTKGWSPDTKRLDRTHACISTLTEYMRTLSRAEALANGDAYVSILENMVKENFADMIVRPMHQTMTAGQPLHYKNADMAKPLKDRIQKVLMQVYDIADYVKI